MQRSGGGGEESKVGKVVARVPLLAIGMQPESAFLRCRCPKPFSAPEWLEVAVLLGRKHIGALRLTTFELTLLFDDEASWREYHFSSATVNDFRIPLLLPQGYKGSWRQVALCQQSLLLAHDPADDSGSISDEFLNRSAPSEAAARCWTVCAEALGAPLGGLERKNWRRGQIGIDSPNSPAWLYVEELECMFNGWPHDCWTAATMAKRFGTVSFTVTLPGHGSRYSVRLDTFLDYAKSTTDFAPPAWRREPLYLFEPRLPSGLASALQNPQRLVGVCDFASECPELRDFLCDAAHGWLLVGGAGSGSRFHVDAHSCGAWNVCLEGRKRWAMYPPGEPPPAVFSRHHLCSKTMRGQGLVTAYASPSPLFWFMEVLPALKVKQRPVVDIIQAPGELVYIPPGWWHSVLNLETFTVGFTRNVVYGLEAVSGVCNALDAAGRADVAKALRTFAWMLHAEDEV